MKKLLTVAALAAAPVLMVAAPAAATDTPAPYTLVAWSIADSANIWATPQVYVASIPLEVASLNSLDASLPCGTYYQIDLYNTGEVTDALIAGKHLDGPNNPQEDLAHGAVEGNPWKYLQTADCNQPPDEVTPGSESVKDCATKQIVTHNWHDTVTYTGDRTGWVASEPVRTVDADTFDPATATDCPPSLALTGFDDTQMIGVGAIAAAMLLLGAAFILANRHKPAHRA